VSEAPQLTTRTSLEVLRVSEGTWGLIVGGPSVEEHADVVSAMRRPVLLSSGRDIHLPLSGS
jgi:hypothetical protein